MKDTIHTMDTVMPEISNLRVHIAPVGYEIDRVVLSAKKMRADKMYLITHDDPADDSKRFLKSCLKKLERANIEVKVVKANRFRIFPIIKTVNDIIRTESNNQIFVNVTTGSKLQAVGCMMACMLCENRDNIHPYYPRPKEYHKLGKNEQLAYGLEKIDVDLPTYKMMTPPSKLITALAIIKYYGTLTKANLADIAESSGLIIINAREKNHNQARYASLDKNIIRALEFDWNFVKVEKIGRHRWISLTKEGEHASEFLLDGELDKKYIFEDIPRN